MAEVQTIRTLVPSNKYGYGSVGIRAYGSVIDNARI